MAMRAPQRDVHQQGLEQVTHQERREGERQRRREERARTGGRGAGRKQSLRPAVVAVSIGYEESKRPGPHDIGVCSRVLGKFDDLFLSRLGAANGPGVDPQNGAIQGQPRTHRNRGGMATSLRSH